MSKEHQLALLIAAFAVGGCPTSAKAMTDFETDFEIDTDNDTVRTIRIDEAVIVASPKETSFLKEQPLSATMFRKDDLEKLHVQSVKHLSAFTPNFYMPDYGSRLTSAAYIRGVGTRVNSPAVGLYVDNVAFVEKSAYDFSFMDVERVDVLRGPQGTLYGRNSMGGLLRVFTADPLKKTGTLVNMGGATHGGTYYGNFTTYLPASERLAFSVGGFYEGQQGFFDNATTGKEADEMSAGGGKIRAAWKPNADLRFDLTTSYEYSDEDACPYYLQDYSKEKFPALSDQVGLISQNRQSNYRRSLFNASLATEWHAPAFLLSSVTGYQYLDDRLKMDQDFTVLDVFSLVQSQKMNAFTEELSLRSHKGKRWQWTSGAFFMYQQMDTDCPVSFYEDGVDFLNGQFKGAPMKIEITNDRLPFSASMATPSLNAALFHQSTFKDLMVDGLSLTVGLRLDYDHHQLDLASSLEEPLFFDFQVPMPHAPEMHLGPVLADLAGDLEDDSWQLLPKVALQYDLPKGNVYAAVTKGYRGGGYNIQAYSELCQQLLRTNMLDAALGAMPSRPGRAAMPSFDAPDIHTLTYEPEQSWNYEMGGHFELLNGKMGVDYTLFFSQTKDQQLAQFSETGMGRVTVNAGKSQSYGAELSARGKFFDDRFLLSASYGYTHAKLTEYDLNKVDYSGNRVPFAPEHTLGVFANFRQPLQGGFFKAFYLGADVQGVGKVYWDEANAYSQPFYATLGVNAGVEIAGKVSMELWGKNITDTRYDTFSFESMGNRFAQWGAPRHFGVRLKLAF